MRRERRSAKDIIICYANELLTRSDSEEKRTKLMVLQTIAYRMGWNDLYEKLRFRKKEIIPVEPKEVEEKWWQK